MSNTEIKTYWRGLAERAEQEARAEEFAELLDLSMAPTSRRSFLKLAGFTLGGAALAGCTKGIDQKAIPLLVQPMEMTPGRASWYATLCGGCAAGCGVVAKSRDGRPIKIEGNRSHPISGGGVCAVGQATVLGLYDSHRLDGPRSGKSKASWEEIDAAVGARLQEIREKGGAVRLLTGTVNGPTRSQAIARFLKGFRDGRHIQQDALSVSAIADAHEATLRRRITPHYRFDRADVIASFDADFLGTWISPVEFSRGYQSLRNPDRPERFSRHVQFESRMSLTGTNADTRYPVAPQEIVPLLGGLAKRIALKSRRTPPEAFVGGLENDERIVALAAELWKAGRGRSLVVCGLNDPVAQRLVNFVNHHLGNYHPQGTLDLDHPARQRLGDDKAWLSLRDEILEGKVAALLVEGCNPLYDLPGAEDLGKALQNVGLIVSFAEREDETAAAAHYLCPDHHPLESWDDAEAVEGTITVSQPLVNPLRGTRAFSESLERWAGGTRSAHEVMRDTWKERVFPRRTSSESFELFWNSAVHDGFVEVKPRPAATPAFRVAPLHRKPAVAARPPLTLVLYPKVALLDGRHAHNAWLQELPDPVTKVTWDNYASFAPRTARTLKIGEGDVVRVSVETGQSVELPAHVQPGQHEGIVAVALGYGRKGTERFHDVGPDWIEARPTVAAGATVGVNAAPLLAFAAGALSFAPAAVTVTRTGAHRSLACTQLYHSLQVPKHLAPKGAPPRPMVQETSLKEYRKDPHAGAHHSHELVDLWPDDHRYTGHHWGMAIDLTACTGCSACVIACQAENNIPVVGRDEVRRQREMHWIRIDRYYSGDEADPEVVHQPMLCQHCDNAPCESVCPVLATVHSSEGLNQQIYNRCVGTRYCANNCPYKTRRFNWFDYPHEDQLQNMVLNPDVVVRMRGVMEKCSFCVQRIQEAKLEAKRTKRPLGDGDIQPACAQSCPTQALVFGDTNDAGSRIATAQQAARHFRVLEELNVKPSVGYLTRVSNRPETKGHGHE